MIKEDSIQKLMNEMQKYKYQCKNCGRKVFIHKDLKKGICDWCGHVVYKRSKDEFKEKLLRELRK